MEPLGGGGSSPRKSGFSSPVKGAASLDDVFGDSAENGSNNGSRGRHRSSVSLESEAKENRSPSVGSGVNGGGSTDGEKKRMVGLGHWRQKSVDQIRVQNLAAVNMH